MKKKFILNFVILNRKRLYLASSGLSGYVVSDGELNLIKFFASSYAAISLVSNAYFAGILDPSIRLTSRTTFRYTVLPAIMEKLRDELSSRFRQASSIVLIADGWSSWKVSEYHGK
jgi:hypothetical protein